MYSEAGQGSFGKTQDWTRPIFSSGPFPPRLWHPCQVICSGNRGTGGDLSGLLNTVQNYKCGCSKAPPGVFPGGREVRSDSALVESQSPQDRTIPSYILIQSRWPRLIPNFTPPSSRWPRPAPGLARSLASEAPPRVSPPGSGGGACAWRGSPAPRRLSPPLPCSSPGYVAPPPG